MARGGGNITQIPFQQQPYTPGPLEALASAAPQIFALIQQSQLQQQLLKERQSATSTADAQRVAGEQQAFAALTGALREPGLELNPQTQAQVGALTSNLGNANQSVNMSERMAQAPAALASVQGDVNRTRNKAAFAAARKHYETADTDMLPAFDTLSTMITQGNMTTAEAINVAQQIGLPRNKAENLSIAFTDAQLRTMQRGEQSDQLATQTLVSVGALPEGTENFSGASDWVRTLHTLKTQFDQNTRLQNQAAANQRTLQNEAQQNAFQNLLVEKVLGLVPILAAPETRFDSTTGEFSMGSSLPPEQIATYMDQLANQFGVTLPRVVQQQVMDEAVKGAAIGAATQALHLGVTQQGLTEAAARTQIRTQLINELGDSTLVNQIMQQVQLPTPPPPDRASSRAPTPRANPRVWDGSTP